MPRTALFRRVVIVCLAFAALHAAPLNDALAADDAAEKNTINALLITGGCCHDYTQQKKILSDGISARTKLPIKWTLIQQGGTTTNTKIEVYEKDDWYKGFDIVVHNECFALVQDPQWTARILKAHRQGVPALVIHCAMHCYRDKTQEWFKFCGVTSHRHGAHYSFDVKNIAKDHPIMAKFGESWTTPKGELYLISKVWDTATPLAHAYSRDTKTDEVCIWTNLYGEKKTRVFGTTIGHHNETMTDKTYLDFLTRGFLWAVDKLDESNLRDPEEANAHKLIPENLAAGKPATAQNHQDGHDPSHAVDGDAGTRWCAHNADSNYWWQVDLQRPQELTGLRITWEFDGLYKYRVEGSKDGKAWASLVDKTGNDEPAQVHELKVEAKDVRYVRITTTGQRPGAWVSFYEFEVFGTKMVKASEATRRAQDARSRQLLAGVKAPDGFDVTLFATPPDVNYPVCLTAAADGMVFVGVDQNGSLDRAPGRGWVTRCLDTDGDGAADQFTQFCKVDSPRGLVWEAKEKGGTLYIMHPPDLSAYHDDDGDGVADRRETLVKGLGFGLDFRGADHTTNGIAMGIDGYLYIAVGDYGFIKAVGKDGRELQLKGGGVVRVRTDGAGMEIYARGLRNICDVAIDPYMNLFTRDNTNDGGGWDIRLSHIIQSAHYGYPSLYKHFTEEIMPPLADYGGGSGTGALYVQEPTLPKPYDDALFTIDWGRNRVFYHPLKRSGASFEAQQEDFVTIERPTDMDVDAAGNLYLASWKGGQFKYDGPNVGYVVRLRAKDAKAAAMPDVRKLEVAGLVEMLRSPSAVRRLAASREIVRRKPGAAERGRFSAVILDRNLSDAARAAAVFTFAQVYGRDAWPLLEWSAADDAIRAVVLRAMADTARDADATLASSMVKGLHSEDARVRLAAIIGLGRVGDEAGGAKLLPFTVDANAAIAHAAIKSMVALKAIDPCLADIDKAGSKTTAGSFRVLRELHEPAVVSGLLHKLNAKAHPHRRDVLSTLVRLYHREGPYEGKWWGTRPDTTGPYYNRRKWSESDRIGAALQLELSRGDAATRRLLLVELQRHRVDLGDTTKMVLALASKDVAFAAQAVEMLLSQRDVPREALPLLRSVALDGKAEAALVASAIDGLMRIGTDESLDAAAAALVHWAGVPDAPAPIVAARQAFVSDNRHARRVEFFIELTRQPDAGRNVLGYAVLLNVLKQQRVRQASRDAASRAVNAAWAAPGSTVSLLYAVAETRDDEYVFQVRSLLDSPKPALRLAAEAAAKRLGLLDKPAAAGPTIGSMQLDDAIAAVINQKGDAKRGEQLFTKLGCVACHTTTPDQPLKGPALADIAKRYDRKAMAQSIVEPSAVIAQGFESQWFELGDGSRLDGFVVREGADELEIRTIQGVPHVIKTKDILERGKSEKSMMPEGLAKDLSPGDLGSVLAYLESLGGK